MIEADNRRPVPMIILECTATSQPFETRSISVAETVKVGRAVAKVRPTSENAIFDCKVLSRNQALFWYSENKFYLQDTKSSNGTYVNSKKLPSESPFEVFSNDIIQFGVEISESSQKTTHNCVIARAKMVHPDGSEAIRGCVPSSAESLISAARSYDVYQIQQYMQEAVRREYILQEKLTALEKFIDETKLSVEDSWKAMINEDKLLGRICFLENQLQIYKTKFDENAMNIQVANISENFHEFEKKWKLKMKFVYEEKTAVMAKSAQFETDLLHCRQECAKLEKEVEDLKFQLKEAYEEADQRRLRIDELTNTLQNEIEAKEEKRDTCDRQILCNMTSVELDKTVHVLGSVLRNLSLNRREENITIDSNYIPSFQTIFENFESLIHGLCNQVKILGLPVNEIIVSELLGSTNRVISEMKRIAVEFDAYNTEVLRILDSSTFCLIGRISDLEAELEERNALEIMKMSSSQEVENDDVPDFQAEDDDNFDEYNENGSKDTDVDAAEFNHVNFAESDKLNESKTEMGFEDPSVLLTTTESHHKFGGIESEEDDSKTLSDSIDLLDNNLAVIEECAAEVIENSLAKSNDSNYELDIMEQRVKLIEAELEKLQDEKDKLAIRYELLLAANSELKTKNSELNVSLQSVSEKADSFAKELVEHKSRHGRLQSQYKELDSEMKCLSVIIHSASFLSKITALSLLIPASIVVYACIFLLNSF